MRTVEEVRRTRLQKLKAEFGTYANLNELLGKTRTDATLSQIANKAKDHKTGRVRELGSEQARRLEQACGKEPGWMDSPADAVEIQYIDLLPPEVRRNLEGLFAKQVLLEMGRLGITIPHSDDAGKTSSDEVKAVGKSLHLRRNGK